MASDLKWLQLALGLAGAVVYCLVGVAVGRRKTSAEASLAMRSFQTWWFGLATLTLTAPLFLLLDALLPHGEGLVFRVFVLNLVILILVAALAGLLYYLVFVYTGKKKVIWPILAYALLEAAWLITIIMQAHPIGYGEINGVACDNDSFCYQNEPNAGSANLLLTLSLFVPILAGTAAYFLLYFRLQEPVQRRRVGMVALALAGWFGSSVVASLVRIRAENAEGVVPRCASRPIRPAAP